MNRLKNISGPNPFWGPTPDTIRREVDKFLMGLQESDAFVRGELMQDGKLQLQIGTPLKIGVDWYDKVPEPPKSDRFEAEIIGWRTTQIIVRIKDYAVVRFWKRTGLEVGNKDYERRGFKLDLSNLEASVRAAREGVEVDLGG